MIDMKIGQLLKYKNNPDIIQGIYIGTVNGEYAVRYADANGSARHENVYYNTMKDLRSIWINIENK